MCRVVDHADAAVGAHCVLVWVSMDEGCAAGEVWSLSMRV
jgi:hypothetical protein